MSQLPAFSVRAAAGFPPQHGQLSAGMARRKETWAGEHSHRRLPELMETTLVKGLSGEGYKHESQR